MDLFNSIKCVFFTALISIFFLTCKAKEADSCIENIKRKLSKDELLLLKTQEGDKLILYIWNELGERIFQDSILEKSNCSLLSLFREEGIDQNGFVAFFIAVHDDLNGREVNFLRIKKQMEAYEKRKALRRRERKRIASKNAELNYNDYEVGDTLCFSFPYEVVDSLGVGRVFIYKQYYYEWVTEWKDTLHLKGILLSKKTKEFDYELNNRYYYFKIKTLYNSKNEEISSIDNNMKERGTFELYLNSYPVRMKNCGQPFDKSVFFNINSIPKAKK